MTVLGEHVAEWVRNPRTGESPKTVMMGGVKLACAGCEWAFEAVNAHIGRPNGYQIEAAGAHGQFFPGWVMPEWMRQYPDVVEAVRARAEAEGKTLENYVLKGTMSDRTVGHDPDESASEWEETR